MLNGTAQSQPRPLHQPPQQYQPPTQQLRTNGHPQLPPPNGQVRMPIHNPSLPPFPHGRSPPNIDNTKHVPCKFYPLGSCNAGDACKFSHNLETAQDRQPCKYFQKGNCKFGAKCALLHIIDGRLVNDPVAQSLAPAGFQRQMVVGGPHQVSGLSSGLMQQQLASNQPPPPPSFQNGYPPQSQASYFPPNSPTGMNDGHFQPSSQHNSPPSNSPPKYRSGLSSALHAHEIDPDSKASSMGLLGPLDAPFPASVDLSNNHIARHGPFAASVPSKFGLSSSGLSSVAGSVRERVVTGDYPGSGAHSPVHGEYGSRYGSPNESSVIWGPTDSYRSSTLLQTIQQTRNPPTSPLHSRPQSSSAQATQFDQRTVGPPPSSRLSHLNRSRLTPISSSVPAAHFGEKTPFSPIRGAEDEDALDPDALPSSLHDEVLLPQELSRRSSQSHAPGLNRRSSAYDDFARSPPSGAVTPGSERGGSLAGSPGSSRMEPIWAKLTDDPVPEFSSLGLNSSQSSRQRVASPLRNPLEPQPPATSYRRQEYNMTPLKTASVHAAQKWGGRTAEKLFPHQAGVAQPSDGANFTGELQGVSVPGHVWRRTGEVIGTGRGELTKEDIRRIKEEEEGTQFSME